MVSTADNLSNKSHSFAPDQYVVYPSHGVGRIVALEEREIAGKPMELIVISFEQDRMLLRLPVAKVKTSGIRHLSSQAELKLALDVLRGRARVRRIMWSRRAQEYESKINSGDVVAIAEVVRDLYKGGNSTEQSYSERQLFEAAFERLVREFMVVENTQRADAHKRLLGILGVRSATQKIAPAEESLEYEEEAA